MREKNRNIFKWEWRIFVSVDFILLNEDLWTTSSVVLHDYFALSLPNMFPNCFHYLTSKCWHVYPCSDVGICFTQGKRLMMWVPKSAAFESKMALYICHYIVCFLLHRLHPSNSCISKRHKSKYSLLLHYYFPGQKLKVTNRKPFEMMDWFMKNLPHLASVSLLSSWISLEHIKHIALQIRIL